MDKFRIMKNAIISFIFAAMIMIGSACSTARDVRVTERRNDDGTIIRTERRVNDDGDVIIKKKKHRRDRILEGRGAKVKVEKNRRNRDLDNDEPVIIIKKDR